MSAVIGDPRPAGQEGPAGDQREAGTEGVAGDPRPAGEGSHNGDEPSFDPSEHTVAEVTAYLEGADNRERGRVLRAERGGKNRATITG
jgi:trigger factor